MLEILQIVLPIFLVLATGCVLMKTGMLNDHFINTSNHLIFNFLLPVLLFSKISGSDFSRLFNAPDIGIMLLSLLTIFSVSFIIARFLHLPRLIRGTFVMNNFRGNFAYMGLPVSYYAFGEEGLAVASILMAFVVPFVNVLSVIALSFTGHESFRPKTFWKNTFYNPLIIACILGIIFTTAKIPLPLFINRTLSIISGVTLPMALFAIGATINLRCLKSSIPIIFTSTIMKLFILPLTAFLFLNIFHLPLNSTGKVMIIMLASPAATVNYIMASSMDGDPDLANGTIVITTVFSIVSFVLWLHLLGTPTG